MQRHLKRVLEHLVGPFGSAILHILVVIALFKFVQFVQQEQAPDVEVVIMEPDAVELEELELEPEQLEEPPEVVDTVIPPVDVAVDQPPPVDDFQQPQEELDFQALEVVSDVASPLVMKGLFAGRSAGGRAAALGQYGGRWAKYTEAAVIKALEWLKRNQAPDGSWGPNKFGMTGLGLLTFLAHGETPASEKYGPTVEKAIRFLVGAQREDGAFAGGGDIEPYAHAIATYSVSEAYGVTRIPALKPVMDKAIEVILKGQQAGGGWDYKYAKQARRDTSVGGWQVQALKAAYIAGASKHSEIKQALDKAVQDLTSAQDPETGRFFYTDKGSHKTDSITAVAVLCLQLTGNGKTKAARDGQEALKMAGCDWKAPPQWAMYAWYYVTQAKFHQGGSTWSSWNDKFARVFVRSQNEDGSWTAPGKAAGVEHGAEDNIGPVYSTTLAALTLQVYYRFLPTYKSEAVETEEEKPEDEVEIQII